MRVVLASAHNIPILLGLNSLNAAGGALLLAFAAPGVGGCLSALRKILSGTDGFLPGEVLRGAASVAGTPSDSYAYFEANFPGRMQRALYVYMTLLEALLTTYWG